VSPVVVDPYPPHRHDVRCGDCEEPLTIWCHGLAARYMPEACPIGDERHACSECATKPRCEECGEIIGRDDRCGCDDNGKGPWGPVADWERDDAPSGLASKEGGKG
jgi:hypothetical protein